MLQRPKPIVPEAKTHIAQDFAEGCRGIGIRMSTQSLFNAPGARAQLSRTDECRLSDVTLSPSDSAAFESNFVACPQGLLVYRLLLQTHEILDQVIKLLTVLQ